MADPLQIYCATLDGPLRQGEVISGLIEPRLVVNTLGALYRDGTAPAIDGREHPLAAVLTQDCDLEGDHRARSEVPPNEKKMLPSVLFCEVHELEALRPAARDLGIDSKRWKILRQNNEPRYHHLQAIPPDRDLQREGLPALGVDFNRFFSMPTELVYAQLKGRARRRFKMQSPYFEHLTTRFFSYQARLALPVPHDAGGD